ncbi:MAG TPA: hypothetical protein PKH24_07795 [Sedimentisphaerales bacterium]|jgi:hypothetical protein|nr:hypothetical protein [Sedimentisphaerales bacterium]HNU29167.1 hypothetical protein [Sedimentisphaerales bacterium]
MTSNEVVECCPRFEPGPWDGTELSWKDRTFVRDRVRSFLHIPLNFGSVMVRNMQKIEAAGAKSSEAIVLSDENSLWGADVYIAVGKEVQGADNVTISGTFLSKVFEGPYQRVPKWIQETKSFVASRGKQIKKLFCYYTTCPKCAKKYGKNYVVILAQV